MYSISAKQLAYLFFLGIPTLLIVIGGPSIWQALRSYAYTSTAPGIVTSAAVIPGSGGNIDLRYEFEVEGRKYQGSRFDSGGFFNSRKYLTQQRFLNEHTVGSKVIVFFDPAAPDNCTLVRGLTAVHIIALIIIVVLPLGALRVWRGRMS
jgi:hypothetical protein